MSDEGCAEVVEERTCKKCGNPLPDSYKRKTCKACRGRRAKSIRKWAKRGMGVASTALLGFFVVKSGKLDEYIEIPSDEE